MNPIQSQPEIQALWEKLERFQFHPNPVVLDFATRLARENGWSHAFAARVIIEYRRFLLLTQRAGHPVTPSEEVDQAWHLHMVYTRSYWETLCRDILGRPLHHEPTAGGPDEGAKFHRQYERTLESYARLFGQSAPADIWPPAEKRFQPMTSRWVDVSRHWLLPKPAWLKWPRPATVQTAAMMALGAIFLAACQPVLEVMDKRGADFLKWYSVSFALAVIASFAWPRMARTGAGRRTSSVTDRFDIAFLGGGVDRVVDAALAALYCRKRVKVDASTNPAKMWSEPPSSEQEELHDVEARVLQAVPASISISPAQVRKTARLMLHSMHGRLAREGLLESASSFRRLRWMAALPVLVVMLLGVAKVFVGISRDRPIAFLIAFLIISLVFLLWRVTRLSHRTTDGELLWKKLRKKPPVTAAQFERNGLMGDPAQVAMLVAMGGYAALHLPAYSTLHSALHRRDNSVTWYHGCGSGCSSGSGCGSAGSSGCGSSGCGGCGGGGD
ncbi:TIGR04222 domain-containing membrane protein [Prosthecobacter sp. SYSU 5D2]|uniref:TIGR04222 domain-containing membrane protein n=1 Tax=Prosthecobacter sp. SYSU 5D2 TaxID=3134134 RepID=UPI0031FEF73B